MIQLNPRYEAIFDPQNIDQECDRIAGLMSVEGDFIKEALDAGLYKQAVTMKAAIKQEQCELAQTLPSVSRLDRRSTCSC